MACLRLTSIQIFPRRKLNKPEIASKKNQTIFGGLLLRWSPELFSNWQSNLFCSNSFFGFGTFFKTFLLFFFSKPLSPLLLLLSVAQPRHFFSSIKLPPLIQLWWFYSGFQLCEWFQQSWYEISPLKSLDSNEESKSSQCNLIDCKFRKCKNINFTSILKEIEGLVR